MGRGGGGFNGEATFILVSGAAIAPARVAEPVKRTKKGGYPKIAAFFKPCGNVYSASLNAMM